MEVSQRVPTITTTPAQNRKPPQPENLDHLIQLIHDAFSEDSVDTDYIQEIMESYKSNPADWKKYAKFDRYKYTRNLVNEGNGKFDLMLLCWNLSQFSPIHDHTNAHCFMKVLQGSLEEVKYAWPEGDENEDAPTMRPTGKTPLHLDQVCYMSDKLGLHRVGNASHSELAVSLHLYCPPFSTCQVFDEVTGRKCSCKVTFFSRYGQKVKYNEKN